MTTDDAPSDAPVPGGADPVPPGAVAEPSPAVPSPGSTEPVEEGFLERLPWWTVPAILIGVPLLLTLVGRFVPGFYQHVVWPYYWGPIKADAMDCQWLSLLHPDRCASATSPGILAHSGYNVVNTLTWAILLGVCIFGLAQMLALFRTPMDDRLIIGATAWVIVGSVTHVLEDTGLFAGNLQFFFITPPIYLLFGAFGVGAFLVGQWMRSTAAKGDLHAALRVLWLVHIVLVVLWLGLWWKGWPDITHYVNPLWVVLFAVLDFFVARTVVLRMGRVDPTTMTLVLSLGTYLLVGAYVVSYLQHPWFDSAGGGMPIAFVVAPLLAGGTVLVLYAIARVLDARGWGPAKAYLMPINLLLVFSQMLDAFATALGIDLHGYTEKHVLSAGVISGFRDFATSIHWTFGAQHPTFLAFAPIKLAVSLLVIWAMDVHSADDSRRHPTMIGLVKFAIIMVGIGPGVRDFTRLSLGV